MSTVIVPSSSKVSGLDAVAGADRDGTLGSTRPSSARCRPKTRMPLPHISDTRSVAVAVVHEPLGVGVPASGPSAADADHPDHAVAADAGPSVAERDDPLGGQLAVDGAVVVGQQHEVVLGAVALEEGVRLSHRDPCA